MPSLIFYRRESRYSPFGKPARLAVATVLLLSILRPTLAAPASQPSTRAATRPADEVPIRVIEDPSPSSLRCWHLYDSTDSRATLEDKVVVVGKVHADGHSIILQSPPWLIVAHSKEKVAGEDQVRTRQVFSLAIEPRKDLRDGAFARFSGVIQMNRPELSFDEKDRRDLCIFRLAIREVTPLPLAREVLRLEADVPAVLRQAEPRIRAMLAKYNLVYRPDLESISQSWYEDTLAFTTIATPHPRFSFKPVPYASVSVLFDPATGKPKEIVVSRRIWQDPRD